MPAGRVSSGTHLRLIQGLKSGWHSKALLERGTCMRVRQLRLLTLFMRTAWGRAIVLSLMLSACSFAASPLDSQVAPPASFPTRMASLFEQGPIDWKSFAPYVQHDQQSACTFPARVACGRGNG